MPKSTRRKSDVRPKSKTVAQTKIIDRGIPVVRNIPDDVPLMYADGLMVQHKDGMFILTFLQTQYPLVITEAEINKVMQIEQKAIARLVVPPSQMAKNVAAINSNFDRFVTKQSEEAKKKLRKSSKMILTNDADIEKYDEESEDY